MEDDVFVAINCLTKSMGANHHIDDAIFYLEDYDEEYKEEIEALKSVKEKINNIVEGIESKYWESCSVKKAKVVNLPI